MLNSDSQGIQKFILERLVKIHDELLIHDQEFRELGEKPREILNQLSAKLPPEDSQLLDEYDSERMAQMNRQDELIYSEALMDGILFGYWVALVGRGMGKINI
ncbi:hypothetical protein EDC14_103037 [Hydrogenispora ethanolica]|jgi:hypothetical protein|uniref:Uncharacterized protein n=1 Tax=Hydrogenispora ethanolica TaxID=1082276 RepID=A0A4R1R8F1_HYDET|nr:hypothetical protein [Hydrogenispora ethanolica]TCL61935.1 hypothetical protein EDC14_103037 [Hydrogenispora ethanolica]